MMMKFWFDTEFYEDGRTIALISIGVVSEDGRRYYAETLDAQVLSRKTDWLRDNVSPHLGGVDATSPTRIARELVDLMGEEPEIWAYYADYDWVALCQLFGTMMQLPKGWPMYCRDIKQLADSVGNPNLPEQDSAEHFALHDAIWAKDTWHWLVDRQIALERAGWR
jgi:hypothetical protein